MNLVILDIAIGLVFVYLIYSLFASAMAEFISHHLGMRSRILRRAIENLLNDFPVRTSFWDKMGAAISDYFLREKDNFKYTKAGEFYRHPGVKYLATERSHEAFKLKKNKPAYIRTETFSSTLLEMIRKFGRGISEWDQIKFSIVNNAAHFDKETAEQLRIMLCDADDDMEKFIGRIEDWFDEMMDRITGWYKRKIRGVIFLIGILLVFGFNVDSLYIVDILSNDEKVRQNMLQSSIQLIEKQEEIAKIDTIVSPSEKDSLSAEYERVKKELDNIKQDALKTNTLLGLGWGFDTLISHQKRSVKLAHSPKPTDEKISMVISIDKKIGSQKDSLKKLEFRIKTVKSHYRLISSDTSYSEKTKITDLDSLTNILINDSLSLDAIVTNLDFIYNDFNKEFRQQYSSIDSIRIDSCMGSCHCKPRAMVYGQSKYTVIDKLSHIWKFANPSKNKFWGLIITALALSLGSQFWFDTLKKLISIRNVGINSDEAKRKEAIAKVKNRKKRSKRGTRRTTDDPAEIALSRYRSFWYQLEGVVAVNSSFSQGKKIIEISIESKAPKKWIESQIQENLQYTNVDYQIVHSEYAAPFSQKPFGSIYNPYLYGYDESVGTAAGRLWNRQTNAEAILTCGHVLHSDSSSYTRTSKDNIYDFQNKRVGILSHIIKSNFMDAAIVDIDFENKNYKKYRVIPPAISAKEALNLDATVTIYKKGRSDIVHGEIIDIDREHSFEGLLGYFIQYDLIIIKHKDGKTPLTSFSDSGALVTVKIDTNEKSLGIVIGGYESTTSAVTFAIPMTEILSKLDAAIIS